MSRDNIVLSVVIPTFNSERHLKECLESVRRERQAGVEFILVDGASSDHTMDLISQNQYLFSYIISEPDKGQSDAFNKGFKAASGRFLTWLNSDDIFCVGAISKALSYLKKTSKEWVVANSVYLNEGGRLMKCCRSGGFEHFAVKKGLLNVFGPSTFFTKRLYQELGPFSTDFDFCMDTEYWWRIVASGYNYERINVYFWGLRLHPGAKTANVILSNEIPKKMKEEGEVIARKYFPHVSDREKSNAVFKARIWRILNGSYFRAFMETLLYRGRKNPHA